MTREQETQLFDQLCRNRPLKEWLESQLARQIDILLVNSDPAQLTKAQGAAGFIKQMADKLNAAENSAKR